MNKQNAITRIQHAFMAFFLLASTTVTQAQPGHRMSLDDYEKMNSIKVGIISKKLNLTPQEAEKFWPVYNQFAKERTSIMKALKQTRPDPEENPDTKQYEKWIQMRLDSKQKRLDLEKTYSKKMLSILSAKQVYDLNRAEKGFHKMLIDRKWAHHGGMKSKEKRNHCCQEKP